MYYCLVNKPDNLERHLLYYIMMDKSNSFIHLYSVFDYVQVPPPFLLPSSCTNDNDHELSVLSRQFMTIIIPTHYWSSIDWVTTNGFNSFMITSISHLVDNCEKQRKLKSWYLILQLSVASNFSIWVINILNMDYIKYKWTSLCLLQTDAVIFISVCFSVCIKLGWFKHLCSPSHLN